MSLSRLAEKCRKCSLVNSCSHKRMEALATLPGEPTLEQSISQGEASPLTIPTMINNSVVTVGGVTISAESIKEQIKEQLNIRISNTYYGGNNVKK